MEEQYLQSYTGNIYKVMDNYLLQISPWKYGDDRRVYEYENDNYHIINYQNACMIVNKQFSNINEEWERNGKRYLASKIDENVTVDQHVALLNMLPNHRIINKTRNLLSSLPNNNSITISSEDETTQLKLIKHNGKIYYILIINEFLPRVKMYDTFGKFCKWANIKNCKPIFNATDKKYI